MPRPAHERITLPTGYWVGQRHHRMVALRELTGADEELVVEHTRGWLTVDRVTLLLTECLHAMDGVDVVDRAAVEALTVGDREALLLHLRRISLGDRLRCTLPCPASGCDEVLELDLAIDEILQPPVAQPAHSYEAELEDGAGPLRLRFRLPTGADQRVAAELSLDDPESGIDRVLERCVEPAPDASVAPAPARWSDAIREALGRRMAELDPQAELVISLRCPGCGEVCSSELDAASFLFGELDGVAGELYRQVHVLASRYHWSEAEILALPTRKRRGYLRLVLDADAPEGWA